MPLLFTCWRTKQTAGITRQSNRQGITSQIQSKNSPSDRFSFKFRCSMWFVCVGMYLCVEAFCILGDSVELREPEHVLLAARPVENPQSERRQCSKYLDHTCTHTHIAITNPQNTVHTCFYWHSILTSDNAKRKSITFLKAGISRQT